MYGITATAFFPMAANSASSAAAPFAYHAGALAPAQAMSAFAPAAYAPAAAYAPSATPVLVPDTTARGVRVSGESGSYGAAMGR